MYPPSGPSGAAGGIGGPAAAADRRKRRWPRPMHNNVIPRGFPSLAAKNHAQIPHSDTLAGLTHSQQPDIVTSDHHPLHPTVCSLPGLGSITQPHQPSTTASFQASMIRTRGSARLHSRHTGNATRANDDPATHPLHPHGRSFAALQTKNRPCS